MQYREELIINKIKKLETTIKQLEKRKSLNDVLQKKFNIKPNQRIHKELDQLKKSLNHLLKINDACAGLLILKYKSITFK